MKNVRRILGVFLLVHSVAIGQVVEIHQIDVGTGDATLINVKNNLGTIQHSILIDAGETNRDQEVIDYLHANAKKNGAYVQLDYIITSHYHSDHYGGMVGHKETLYQTVGGGNKRRRCGEIYTGVLADTTIKYFAVLDKGTSSPSSQSNLYKKYNTLAGARRTPVGTTTVGNFGAVNSITPTATFPPPNPTAAQQLSLGGYIDLGADVNGTPIRLRLVVANAKVYAPGVNMNTYNVADTLGVSKSYTGNGARPNPNNWGLGWVLEYGAFRYYTAGDIGGYNGSYGSCTSCGSNYFDIETPLAAALQLIYTNPNNSTGHICSQKLSHHGSCCSTNPTFWGTLRPSSGIISAGHVASFGHPTQEVITRIETQNWAADSLRGTTLDNYLMTELWFQNRNIDLSKGGTSGSISLVATQLVIPPTDIDTAYLMANGSSLYELKSTVPQKYGDVIIKVSATNAGFPIAQQSRYSIEYVDYLGNNQTLNFNCHGQ